MDSSPSQFFSALLTRQFLTMAGYTVLTYDYFLTFDLEVDHIWRTPWSVVKVIFLLNRYGTLFGMTFYLLEEVGILSHGSSKFCVGLTWFQGFLLVSSSETVRTLLLLRAWSLWRCSYRIAISMVCIYVFYVLVFTGYMSYILLKYADHFVFPYLDQSGVCVAYPFVDRAWLLGAISLLLDTGMFAVIAYCLYALCKETQQLQYSPLLRLLLRDAVLFYMVIVLHDAVTSFSMSYFLDDPRNVTHFALTFPFHVVAGQRVVLNLRSFRSGSCTTQDVSRVVNQQLAAMQHRSFWQTADVWMNDLHHELRQTEELSRQRRTRTLESRIMRGGNEYELQVLRHSAESTEPACHVSRSTV